MRAISSTRAGLLYFSGFWSPNQSLNSESSSWFQVISDPCQGNEGMARITSTLSIRYGQLSQRTCTVPWRKFPTFLKLKLGTVLVDVDFQFLLQVILEFMGFTWYSYDSVIWNLLAHMELKRTWKIRSHNYLALECYSWLFSTIWNKVFSIIV